MRLNNIVLKPLITEKNVANNSKLNEYVFKVNYRATKGSIAQQVHELFDVKVTSVRTLILPGKQKRVGKTKQYTKSASWKKAVVRLAPDNKIDLFPKEK